MKLRDILESVEQLNEGKLSGIAQMVIKTSPAAQDDANFGKFIPKKNGYNYSLVLFRRGVSIPLVEYMTGGENPYVKFILPKELNKVLPTHLVGEITSLFADIYNNGAGKLVEGSDQLGTKVVAKRMAIKAIGSKAVVAGIGQTLILDRKTPPGVEASPSLDLGQMEEETEESQEKTEVNNIASKKQQASEELESKQEPKQNAFDKKPTAGFN
jgi:hypothetical protein